MERIKTKPARSGGDRESKTVAKLMDAAEALFLRLGYEGTSMRAIALRAKVSLGTIVYHWGTKETLFREICLRRFGAIREDQLRRLRACETAGGTTAADLEAVLRALVEPPLLTFKDPDAAQTTRLLYGRALTDPSQVVLHATAEIFSEASNLYLKLVRHCLPDLDEESFYWRYTCALGAFIFAQSFGHRVAYATRFDAFETNWGEAADEIVASMMAILLNPR